MSPWGVLYVILVYEAWNWAWGKVIDRMWSPKRPRMIRIEDLPKDVQERIRAGLADARAGRVVKRDRPKEANTTD